MPTHATPMPMQGSSDPWWTYNMMKAQPNASQPAPAAPMQGPTEQRFAQQDAKMQELEQKIEAMSAQQYTHEGQITQLQQDLVSTEQRIVQNVNQSMEGVKLELQKSFGDALACQTKQFEASLLSLRQAIVQPKRKNPSKAAEDMSD